MRDQPFLRDDPRATGRRRLRDEPPYRTEVLGRASLRGGGAWGPRVFFYLRRQRRKSCSTELPRPLREQVPLHRLLPPLPGGQKLLLDTTILRKTTPPVLLQALRVQILGRQKVARCHCPQQTLPGTQLWEDISSRIAFYISADDACYS